MISLLRTPGAAMPNANTCNAILYGSIFYVDTIVTTMTNAGTSDMDGVINQNPAVKKMQQDFEDVIQRLSLTIRSDLVESPAQRKRKDNPTAAMQALSVRNITTLAKRIRTRATTSNESEIHTAQAINRTLQKQPRPAASEKTANSPEPFSRPVGFPLPKMRRVEILAPTKPSVQPNIAVTDTSVSDQTDSGKQDPESKTTPTSMSEILQIQTKLVRKQEMQCVI